MSKPDAMKESEYAVLNNPNLLSVIPEAMGAVPRSQFSIGFGLHASSPGSVTSRNAAFEKFVSFIDRSELALPNLQLARAIQAVRDTFVSVSVGADKDWFTTARHLGYPSSELARECAFVVHQTGQALISQDAELFEDCLDFLVEEPVLEMLETYQATTLGGQDVSEEKEWAYILWSSGTPAVLQIGATDLTLEETLAHADRTLDIKHPYGVLAAWLVHDPIEAMDAFAKEFHRYRRHGSGYEAPVGEVKTRISELLHATNNFVLSPWHVDPL